MRIAKAVRENRWNKAKSLCGILVRSQSAKFLAVRKVTSSAGGKTPGVDRVTWKSDKSKFKAVLSLGKRAYRAMPLRRVMIPKANGKKRPLGIPTLMDRAMMALYLLALEPIAETKADPHSYGFRPKRSVKDAIDQCRKILAQNNRATWILEGDIKACFDCINHPWLLDWIPMDRSILQKWLTAGVIYQNRWSETKEGTPQGSPISPTLANMVLDGLQEHIRNSVPPGSKVNFVRYADDFICTAKDRRLLESVVRPAIQSFLKERGLELSPEKTKITNIEEGFDFLGFNIRKYKGKFKTKPAKDKVLNFIRKTKELIKQRLRTEPIHRVIPEINRKLMGWCYFYRNSCASEAFAKIDYELFVTIVRTLKRHQFKKSKSWIRDNHFTRQGNRSSVFFAKEQRMDWVRGHYLYQAGGTKILPYCKIKAAATIYDPEFAEYFTWKARTQAEMMEKDKQTRQVTTSPWFNQKTRKTSKTTPKPDPQTGGLNVA